MCCWSRGPGGGGGTLSFFWKLQFMCNLKPLGLKIFKKRLEKFLKNSKKIPPKKFKKISKIFQKNSFHALAVAFGHCSPVGRERGGMGQRGKERQVMIEESGVLRESETPSGDLLGYRLRYG